MTREWHEAALRMRMVPLEEVFRRLPRLVRALSRQLGKNVDLVVEGKGTEADKDVVDGLFEPLVHLVRNSLDHGIETPEERHRAGKPETARLTLRASQEANRVVVEVADDGRGVDAEALRRMAVARGVMEAERAPALTEAEAVDLVFASGLSTAEAVSEISGRGIGMDAVRATVERAGGTATIRSRPGQGTSVRLVLPFSVTLAQILTVDVDGHLFGLPLDRVRESVHVARARIQRLRDGAAAFAIGDRVVPLLSLRQALGLPDTAPASDPDRSRCRRVRPLPPPVKPISQQVGASGPT